ncbi:putative bifunctional diguanylate cyclase/phosphodiesterase, partial [Lentzea sp. NPDC004789]
MELRTRLDSLCALLHEEPFSTAAVEQAGEELVTLGHLGQAGLRCTTEVLGKGLLGLPEFRPVERYAERVALALGAFGCGFTGANVESVLTQQEGMQKSLLKAVHDANWNLRESETRFNEVVTSSTNGVLIVDLDGRLLKVNAAVTDILGHAPEDLVGVSLVDLVAPGFAEMLRNAMAELVSGAVERVRQSQRMLCKDGEAARLTLTASLLRGADDTPTYFVVVVEDGTELALLQGELKRQSLHDVLTGLPNRQFFTTQLEIALRNADPRYGVTIFHIDLDAFGMLYDSFGARNAERFLQHVAGRLEVLLAGEKAMIARIGGDEFGVLVENTATTPDVGAIMKSINEDLLEPAYVDGHGLAVSVSAGVVHRPSPDVEPIDLLRAAERALRKAKTGRRGQWEVFHAGQDAEDRRDDALAVRLPAAWENGEIAVRYRPVVRLADGATGGVEAALRWDRPDGEALAHDRCVELAESTGLILPLGEWLLRVAGGQSVWWRQRGRFDHPLVVRLTAHQAADADLVSRVVRVLEETGLAADRLMVGMPTKVLRMADAADNLAVLARIGVLTALDDFGLGPWELAWLSELPVAFVLVPENVLWRADPRFTALVPAVHELGVRICVDGIDTEEQAKWWTEVGADLAIAARRCRQHRGQRGRALHVEALGAIPPVARGS